MPKNQNQPEMFYQEDGRLYVDPAAAAEDSLVGRAHAMSERAAADSAQRDTQLASAHAAMHASELPSDDNREMWKPYVPATTQANLGRVAGTKRPTIKEARQSAARHVTQARRQRFGR